MFSVWNSVRKLGVGEGGGGGRIRVVTLVCSLATQRRKVFFLPPGISDL